MSQANAENVHAQWVRIGIGFDMAPAQEIVPVESLFVRTCSLAADFPRLFWAASSWLAVHHQLVNGRLLGKELDNLASFESAIAGASLSVALELNPTASTLNQALSHCRPLLSEQILFSQYASNPVLADYARQESLALFRYWGFSHNQVSDKRDAIRTIAWIIRSCPDLRIRSMLGASLDAEIMHQVMLQQMSATALMERIPFTYAAIHEAASRLCDRGLLRRRVEGRAVILTIPSHIRKWINQIAA